MRREDSAVKRWRMTSAVEESFKKRETTEVIVYVEKISDSGSRGMVMVVCYLYMAGGGNLERSDADLKELLKFGKKKKERIKSRTCGVFRCM